MNPHHVIPSENNGLEAAQTEQASTVRPPHGSTTDHRFNDVCRGADNAADADRLRCRH